MKIETAQQLVELAGNPTVLLTAISGDLLKAAAELLGDNLDAAVRGDAQKMAETIKALRDAAGRLAGIATASGEPEITTDGSKGAKRSQRELEALYRTYSDEFVLWRLALRVMSPDQKKVVLDQFNGPNVY